MQSFRSLSLIVVQIFFEQKIFAGALVLLPGQLTVNLGSSIQKSQDIIYQGYETNVVDSNVYYMQNNSSIGLYYGLLAEIEIGVKLNYIKTKTSDQLIRSSSGFSDVEFDFKKMFEYKNLFYALSAAYLGPAAAYSPGVREYANGASGSYLLGLHSTYSWKNFYNMYSNLDYYYLIRTPRKTSNEHKFILSKMLPLKNWGVGVFFGGIQNESGFDIGSDEYLRWYVSENPFAHIDEKYYFLGSSGYIKYLDDTISLSFYSKLSYKLKNSQKTYIVELNYSYETFVY